MGISRRKFIHKTGVFAAGSCLVPSLSLSSCDPSGKAGHVRMGFVGPEEHFSYYKPLFQKLKNTQVLMTSLDEALESTLHAIFIDSFPTIKPTHIILLLLKNKDIITPYPLANRLDEYNRIQEFSEIQVSCHPKQLVKGYHVNGYAGTVQPLQRMISYITGKFPLSLFIEKNGTKGIQRWMLDYESFQTSIRTDPGQTGWILEVEGPQLSALTDHTGLLRLNDEVEPRLSPATSVWARSMIKNLEDFIQAVRLRGEPMVNSLEGLSAIILNQAAVKSIQNGSRVNL